MIIDGKTIAQQILQDLLKRVKKLKAKKIIPHLAIILIGDDPASSAYVRQKELKTNEIGAKTTIQRLPVNITQQELLTTIQQFNNNNNVHGIIAQRPLPSYIDHEEVALAVNPKKDVDGLRPNSPFPMPLAAAVIRIFEHIASFQGETLRSWLKNRKIVVIGKGETGGGAVIKLLRKMGIEPKVIDSKTPNPQHFMKAANIIISAVGKPSVISANMIKKGVVLIGIGLHKGPDGKLHGDYEGEKITDIASFYTPTPGGVGPVNVAMLLVNLIKATENTL